VGAVEGSTVMNFPDANTLLNSMLHACQRPDCLARVRIGDGEWEEIAGPVLLERLSEGDHDLTFDSVRFTVPVHAHKIHVDLHD
jgi:hypothetical protein